MNGPLPPGWTRRAHNHSGPGLSIQCPGCFPDLVTAVTRPPAPALSAEEAARVAAFEAAQYPVEVLAAHVVAGISRGEAIVCLTRCESCMFGCCFDEPRWHSWAGPEDVAHAKATGQTDPSDQRCGCSCAEASR